MDKQAGGRSVGHYNLSYNKKVLTFPSVTVY